MCRAARCELPDMPPSCLKGHTARDPAASSPPPAEACTRRAMPGISAPSTPPRHPLCLSRWRGGHRHLSRASLLLFSLLAALPSVSGSAECLPPSEWGGGAAEVCPEMVYTADPSARFGDAVSAYRDLTAVLNATGASTLECQAATRRVACLANIPACAGNATFILPCSRHCSDFKRDCSAAIAIATRSLSLRVGYYSSRGVSGDISRLLDCHTWEFSPQCRSFAALAPCLDVDSPAPAADKVVGSVCSLPETHPLRNTAATLAEAYSKPQGSVFRGVDGKFYGTIAWVSSAVLVCVVAFYFTTDMGREVPDIVAASGGDKSALDASVMMDAPGSKRSEAGLQHSPILLDGEEEEGPSGGAQRLPVVDRTRRLSFGERVFSIRFCTQIVSMLLTIATGAVIFFVSANQVEKDLIFTFDAQQQMQEDAFDTGKATALLFTQRILQQNADSAKAVLGGHLSSISMTHSFVVSGLSGQHTKGDIFRKAFSAFRETSSDSRSQLHVQVKSVNGEVDRILSNQAAQSLLNHGGATGGVDPFAGLPALGVYFPGAGIGVAVAAVDDPNYPTPPSRYPFATIDPNTGVVTTNPITPKYGVALGHIEDDLEAASSWTTSPLNKKLWQPLQVNFGQLSIGLASTLYVPPTFAEPRWTVATSCLLTEGSVKIAESVIKHESERVIICENTPSATLFAASHAPLTRVGGSALASAAQNDDTISTVLFGLFLKSFNATSISDPAVSRRVVTTITEPDYNTVYRGLVDDFTYEGLSLAVMCFIPVYQLEEGLLDTAVELRKRFDEQVSEVKGNEERSHRFLVFVSMLLVFLAIILSLVASSTSTSALQTVIEDLKDIGHFRLTRLHHRHQGKPLSKMTEVCELQRSIRETLLRLQEYRNMFPSLALAVKAMGRRRVAGGGGGGGGGSAWAKDDDLLMGEDPLALGMKDGFAGTGLFDASARGGKTADMATERSCKVTVIYLSRNQLKKQDRKKKRKPSDTSLAGSDLDVEMQKRQDLERARAVKKTSTFEWHYSDPATASLPGLLRSTRTALGEMVGEPLELTAVIPRGKAAAAAVLSTAGSSPLSSGSGKRPTFDDDSDDEGNPDTQYPLRHSHHLQDFLLMYPDQIQLHVKKNSKTNYLAPLTALASVFGKIGLVLMVFRMYWSDYDVGTRLAPVQVVILILGFALNLVWSFKLSRKANETEEQMAEWTSNFQTETTLVMVLSGFNMQNMLLLWCGLRVGGLLRFHAPFPRKIRTQVIRWSMFSLIVGDVLPLTVTLFFLQETGGWGSDFTAEVTVAMQIVAILTGSVKKFVAFCLVDDKKVEREEMEQEKVRLKKTKNSILTPQALTVLKLRLGSAYQSGDLSGAGVDFTGLKGKSSGLDPIHLGVNLRRFYATASAAVRSRRGMVVDSTDGEVTAIFNHPFPVERHQVTACSAAVEILRSKPKFHARPNTPEPPNWLSMSVVSGVFLKGNLRADGRSYFHFMGESRQLCDILLQHSADRDLGIVANEAVMEKVYDSGNELLTEYFSRRVGAVRVSGTSARDKFYQIVPLQYGGAADQPSPYNGRLRYNGVLWRSEALLADAFRFLDEVGVYLSRRPTLPGALAGAPPPAPPSSFSAAPFPANPSAEFIPVAMSHFLSLIRQYMDEIVYLGQRDPEMHHAGGILESVRAALKEATLAGRTGPAVLEGIYPASVCVCGRKVISASGCACGGGSPPPGVASPLAGSASVRSGDAWGLPPPPAYPDMVAGVVRSPARPTMHTFPGVSENESAFSILSPREDNDSFAYSAAGAVMSPLTARGGAGGAVRPTSSTPVSPTPRSVSLAAALLPQAGGESFASDNEGDLEATSLVVFGDRLSPMGYRHPLRAFPNRRLGGSFDGGRRSLRNSLVSTAAHARQHSVPLGGGTATPRTPGLNEGMTHTFESVDSPPSDNIDLAVTSPTPSNAASGGVGRERDTAKILMQATSMMGLQATGRGDALQPPAPPRRRRKLAQTVPLKATVSSGVNVY